MINGISLDDGDEDEEEEVDPVAQQIQRWEEDYGPFYSSLYSRPKEDWNSIDICQSEASGEGYSLIDMALMGQKERRCHPEKHVTLRAPKGSMEQALTANRQPYITPLEKAEGS